MAKSWRQIISWTNRDLSLRRCRWPFQSGRSQLHAWEYSTVTIESEVAAGIYRGIAAVIAGSKELFFETTTHPNTFLFWRLFSAAVGLLTRSTFVVVPCAISVDVVSKLWKYRSRNLSVRLSSIKVEGRVTVQIQHNRPDVYVNLQTSSYYLNTRDN